MSTCYYLVCLDTQQSVEVAVRAGVSVRASQEPKALALFCEAHTGKVVAMMSEHDLEARNLDQGELTEWTDADAEIRYTALTGDRPPDY